MNLVWFRRDLRVLDNPALHHACLDQSPVIALFIRTPETWSSHDMSHVQQIWLEDNLNHLENALKKIGIPLYRTETNTFGQCPNLIAKWVKKYDIKKLFYNKEYAFDEKERDRLVDIKMETLSVETKYYDDACLVSPETIKTKEGTPYRVFTPYKKQVLSALLMDETQLTPYRAPKKRKTTDIQCPQKKSMHPQCTQDISWLKAGETAAHKQLICFVESQITRYLHHRDFPDLEGTSRLSPYLAIGVLSPRQCVNAILDHHDTDTFSSLLSDKNVACWVSELIWRDFYKMICHFYPHVSKHRAFKQETDRLLWSNRDDHFQAWCDGRTGVPIIDAAMRQLNETAWMHNRLRMVTAMYFTKNLWLDWRQGETYFASRLVDWDFASNNGGWQWCASTGTDAAPYFRIFNPVTQSERFDPKGSFIRQYCPELKSLSDKHIHQPLVNELKVCDYPLPLVDLKQSRQQAIDAFKALSRTK